MQKLTIMGVMKNEKTDCPNSRLCATGWMHTTGK